MIQNAKYLIANIRYGLPTVGNLHLVSGLSVPEYQMIFRLLLISKADVSITFIAVILGSPAKMLDAPAIRDGLYVAQIAVVTGVKPCNKAYIYGCFSFDGCPLSGVGGGWFRS